MRVSRIVARDASAEVDQQMVGRIDRGVAACIRAVSDQRSAGCPLAAER